MPIDLSPKQDTLVVPAVHIPYTARLVLRSLDGGATWTSNEVDLAGAFATESISHIKLERFVNSSGQAPYLRVWEICLAGVMAVSANSDTNEGFRVKPMAG